MAATLLHGDCLDAMATIADQSIDAIICDPPYPMIDRPYGKMTEADWHAMMRGVVAESRRILKPSGSAVFILQPNSERVGRMRPWLFEFQAWTCREWNMIQDAWWWNLRAMPEAHAIQGRLMRPSVKACVWLGEPNCYRDQDSVLWEESCETKARRTSERANKGLSDVRVNCPSGHGFTRNRILTAAESRGGVTPYNLMIADHGRSQSSAGGFGHPAGTPYNLADWWTRYISPPGGVVCDPFMGSGTMGLAAIARGRQFVGVERDAGYFAIAETRIRAAESTPCLFAAPAPPMPSHAIAPAPTLFD